MYVCISMYVSTCRMYVFSYSLLLSVFNTISIMYDLYCLPHISELMFILFHMYMLYLDNNHDLYSIHAIVWMITTVATNVCIYFIYRV